MNIQTETAAAIKQERALKKKKLRKRLIIGTGILLFGYVLYLLFVPYKGSITYGVCKTLLEQIVPYPDHLRLSSVDDYGSAVRIWFTQVDSFGEYRLEALACNFRESTEADNKKYGQQMPFVLEKASINRRDIDAKAIERFNISIPTIVMSNPNLTLPSPLPDSLDGLQIDASQVRKPLF